MSRIVFVEFELDDLDAPPVSWFVNATEEQEKEIDKLIHDTIEDWQRPYVGEARPMDYDVFIEEFKAGYGRSDDETTS